MTHIVFDVGRVLVDWQPDTVIAELLGGAEALQRFHATVDFMAWHGEQDRGRSPGEAVADMAARHPEYAAMAEALYARWLDTIPGPIPGMPALMEAAAARAPIYAITNFPAEQWPRTVESYPFLTRFQDVVVSGRERLVKPDPAIFDLLIARNGLAAGDCLFIDDSPRNVVAARGVGMDAVLFTDTATLQADFAARGIAL